MERGIIKGGNHFATLTDAHSVRSTLLFRLFFDYRIKQSYSFLAPFFLLFGALSALSPPNKFSSSRLQLQINLTVPFSVIILKLPFGCSFGWPEALNHPVGVSGFLCYYRSMEEKGTFLSIDSKDLERYLKKDLRQLRGAIAGARRALMNNMAFAVREIVLTWGVPRVMTVRNPNILRITLRVQKARRGGDERATLYQTGKNDTWDALRVQEFGGMMGQQVATLEARGGAKSGKIKSKARMKPGNIISPEDISVAHEQGEAHRVHVFLQMLQRGDRQVGGDNAHNQPFILGSAAGFRPGLFRLGRKMNQKSQRGRHRKWFAMGKEERVSKKSIGWLKGTRQIKRLRSFGKEQTPVRRLKWLRPSIDRYLRTTDPKMEWRKAMRHAMARKHT